MGALGIVGAFAGTRVAVGVDPRVLRPAVGAMLLGLVAFAALARPIGTTECPPRLGRGWTALLGVPLGFYEGLLGSGNSVVTSFALCGTRGLDAAACPGALLRAGVRLVRVRGGRVRARRLVRPAPGRPRRRGQRRGRVRRLRVGLPRRTPARPHRSFSAPAPSSAFACCWADDVRVCTIIPALLGYGYYNQVVYHNQSGYHTQAR